MPLTNKLEPNVALPSHRISDRADVLGRILEPDVNLSLWCRPAQPSINRELSSVRVSDLPDIRHPTSSETFDDDVVGFLRQQGLEPASLKHLRADMGRLAALFAAVSDGRPMVFRLFATDENDCKRFHLDRKNLRLICTYEGPGTEWLEDQQVDRNALAQGAPNKDVIRFGDASRFAPFWVGIMKGDPANDGTGLVHRSPEIEGLGRRRVLFCLDS